MIKLIQGTKKVTELGEYGIRHESMDMVFTTKGFQQDIIEVFVPPLIVLYDGGLKV